MASKGMIQSYGITYRIVSGADRYYVIRLLDDAAVGSFRHAPVLEVIESTIGRSCLLALAQVALRQGRLDWMPATVGRGHLLSWTRCLSVLWRQLLATLAAARPTLQRL